MTRADAARWVSARLGRRVSQEQLRAWEARGLLDRKRPGRRHPARFDGPDVLRALVVSRLRLLENEPVDRVRRASLQIRDLWPALFWGRSAYTVDRRGNIVILAGDPSASWGPPLDLARWADAARDAVRQS